MKTLILTVDRDDDIGRKANVATPVVGRRRVVETATALGCADPEDSDTNSLFAAAHLYDKELAHAMSRGNQVEVAAIAGHPAMGLRADRKLARELEEVLELTRADEVILVSDGAEDEQIMPILTSLVRVAHVHRTIVRQAPRLEGVYYVVTRLFQDKKLGRKYIMPLGVVTMIWAAAFFLDWANYAWGATLGLIGLWLVVHAMHWEERMSRFISDFVEGLRSGKITVLANIVGLLLVGIGVMEGYAKLANLDDQVMRVLLFLDGSVPLLVAALLVRVAGILFDQWIRDRRAQLRHWTTAFSLVAVGFIGSAVIRMSIAIRDKTPWTDILDYDLMGRLFIGIFVAMSGLIVARYVKNFFDDDPLVRN
jgi:putative membrane protein